MSQWVIQSHEASKAGGAKPIGPFLNNKTVIKMAPQFDDKTDPDDRRCSNCFMRIAKGEENIAECTIVSGGVSLSKGVCDWWGQGDGKPSSQDDMSQDRMAYAEAGYAEFPAETKVQCGTCYYYESIDSKVGNCLLWMHRVKLAQCCMKYKNESETVPEPYIEVTS
jgi:hypothetical protein